MVSSLFFCLVSLFLSVDESFAFPAVNVARFSSTSGKEQAKRNWSCASSRENEIEPKPIGNIAFLLPGQDADTIKSKFGSKSPVANPSLEAAAAQLCRKATWFSDDRVQSFIHHVPAVAADQSSSISALLSADVLIVLGLSETRDLEFASKVFEERKKRDPTKRKRQCQFGLDCTEALPSFVGPYDPDIWSIKSTLTPWSEAGTASRLFNQMTILFNKWNTDEFVFALMIFLNQFSGSQIDWVKYSIDATWEKGPVQNGQELFSMVSKCGDCITRCVQDESCRECLTKLTAVDTRDQVASYRTIVSYESELLRDFSYCILQKNNIFNCDATIPMLPKVPVLTSFRGEPLTEDIAKQILIGHLDEAEALKGSRKSNLSWLVACGANEAYDKFPSQHQLFYSAVRGRNLWYDPVFRVETLNGNNVWCKRHYKVRPGKEPGTFYFSVLDNGITSSEFWTIVAVADDLSWIVFHYAGAASAVGQRYLGGLLCTPDGSLPDQSQLAEVWDSVRKAGIEPWELFVVNNDKNSPGYVEAGDPPLNYFRESVLAEKQKELKLLEF